MTPYLFKILASAMLLMFGASTIAHATEARVVHTGEKCEVDTIVKEPYSVVFLDGDSGRTLYWEHIGCDGVRTVGGPDGGDVTTYKAYESTLHSDNVPLLSHGMDNTIVISLNTPARVEVRDGVTGSLITSITSIEEEHPQLVVSASDLAPYIGSLIVVDVIRASDNSYRGTASIPYAFD